MNNINSCAILVRIMLDERPYLNEFLDHYFKLKFDHIYFIATQGISLDYLRCIAAEFHERITIIHYSNLINDWQDLSLNYARSFISEDWVLNIDMDEYLVLKDCDIKKVIKNNLGYNKFKFSWIICLSTSYSESSVYEISKGEKFISKTFKTMSSVKEIEVLGIHDSLISGAEETLVFEYDYAFIYHFASRGFYDLINRIIGRNYENRKSGPSEELALKKFLNEKFILPKHFPFRFNLYRIQLTFPVIYLGENLLVPPTYCIDNLLLELIFVENLKKINIYLTLEQAKTLDLLFEREYNLKQKIFLRTPANHYPKMHLDEGRSYIYITNEYIKSL